LADWTKLWSLDIRVSVEVFVDRKSNKSVRYKNFSEKFEMNQLYHSLQKSVRLNSIQLNENLIKENEKERKDQWLLIEVRFDRVNFLFVFFFAPIVLILVLIVLIFSLLSSLVVAISYHKLMNWPSTKKKNGQVIQNLVSNVSPNNRNEKASDFQT